MQPEAAPGPAKPSPAPTVTPPTSTAPGRQLRILMVLQGEFTLKGGGGAESQVRTISLELKRLGHMVTILTPRFLQGPQSNADRRWGLPIGRINYPHWRVVGAGIMCARLAAFLLGRGRRYDAWHVHVGHHFGAVACYLGALIGKPVLLKFSGSWELESGLIGARRRGFDQLAFSWLKRARVVHAVSARIGRDLPRLGFPPDRILVLPNAVDTSRFQVRGVRQRAPGTPFTVLFVGRLHPDKDLGVLLDAWADAFAGRTDVRLKLVGKGILGDELRAQAERRGIAGQVDFLGHRDKVEDEIAQADVGVLCSRIEGLSNTLLEFMASGLPTIASRISGSEDFVVGGRNGWMFEPSDVAGLTACLRDAAAATPEQLHQLGQAARADVEAKASVPRVVNRLIEVYRGGGAG